MFHSLENFNFDIYYSFCYKIYLIMDTLLKIEKLKFGYVKERTVLDIKNLSIEKNKIYLLLGKNGSGKTTLLKILSGLIKVEDIEIDINDKKNSYIFKNNYTKKNFSLIKKTLKKMSIYVHQHPIMLTGNVFYNIAYPLKIIGTKKEDISNKVNSIMKRLSIDHLSDKNSREISTGEAQKVAIARAVITNREIVLLDEPIANIDKDTLLNIEELLLDLKNSRTIILSSHNSFLNYRMCDYVISLENGKNSLE